MVIPPEYIRTLSPNLPKNLKITKEGLPLLNSLLNVDIPDCYKLAGNYTAKINFLVLNYRICFFKLFIKIDYSIYTECGICMNQ